ncbi:MAG: VWA domain-containing protein [Pirellulales bacterium]
MVNRPPPPPKKANLAAGSTSGGSRADELQRWIASLETQHQAAGKRNRWWLAALVAGVVLLAGVAAWVHQSTVGTYAVLREVQIAQNGASQGRMEISFDVVRPGRVSLVRRSAGTTTEVIDTFLETGPKRRSWSWIYEPGAPIDVSVGSRGWLGKRVESAQFPTSSKADIVVLIDTTGSMDRSLAALRERCVEFSQQLQARRIEHRFALAGFGDATESDWIDVREFTSDVATFQRSVAELKRFDGGDLPESALDAVERALDLPLADDALRRFYLVTDAQFHSPTRSGLDAATLAERLVQRRVSLHVFAPEEFHSQYAALAGEVGAVQTIEDFGRVLAEGRILED